MWNRNRCRTPRPVVHISSMTVLSLLISAGCSGLSHNSSQSQADTQGSVGFEEVVDWSFEASHPITINQDALSRILHGIRIGTDQNSLVFADREIEFLSPAIATALAQAAPEQVVIFQVFSQAGSVPEATGGTIYAKGPSIYLTLTQFRSKPITTGFWSWVSGKPSPPEELTAEPLSFVPGSAARTQRAAPEIAMNYSNLSTLVIDHLALARLAGQEHLARMANPQAIPAQTGDPSHWPLSPEQAGTTVFVPAAPTTSGPDSTGEGSQDRPRFIPAVRIPRVELSPGTTKAPAASQPAPETQSKPGKPVKSKKSSRTTQAKVKQAPQQETP